MASRIAELAEKLQKTTDPKEALDLARQIREAVRQEKEQSEPSREAEPRKSDE